MSGTKILWGQILIGCAVVLAFLWAATEWTAWQLAFQPQLGRPWFEIFGWPFYDPLAFFWWWFSFDAYAHEIFVEGGFIAGGISVEQLAIVRRRCDIALAHQGKRRFRQRCSRSLRKTCSANDTRARVELAGVSTAGL